MREAETFNRGHKRGSDGAVLRMVRNINVCVLHRSNIYTMRGCMLRLDRPENEIMEEDGMSASGAVDQEQVHQPVEHLRPNYSASEIHHGEHRTIEGSGGERSLPTGATSEDGNIGFQPVVADQLSDWGMRYNDNPSFDLSPSWNGGFGLSQEETNQLLTSLQESVPDVGRLFDGSIGTFGWT